MDCIKSRLKIWSNKSAVQTVSAFLICQVELEILFGRFHRESH